MIPVINNTIKPNPQFTFTRLRDSFCIQAFSTSDTALVILGPKTKPR